MAEITSQTTSPDTRVRRKKLSTKVDLTPMVDLGFLLITFFVFTTSLEQPRIMPLFMPADGPPTPTGESSTLTIVPANNIVFYYHGQWKEPMAPGTYGITNYSVANGIGQIIREKQAAMERVKTGFSKELNLLIKPDETANYGEVVRMIDEVLINDIHRYSFVNLDEPDRLIAAKYLVR